MKLNWALRLRCKSFQRIPRDVGLSERNPLKEKVILLVEDNRDEELLALRALAKNSITNNVIVARDGVEPLDHLLGTGAWTDKPAPLPQVALLDLKLPTALAHKMQLAARTSDRIQLRVALPSIGAASVPSAQRF